MKYTVVFLLSISILIPIKAVAQKNCFFPELARNISSLPTIYSGNTRIKYALSRYGKNVNDNDDLHILEIGKSLSKYFSYNVYRENSILTDKVKRNPNIVGFPHWSNSTWESAGNYFWAEYYKDYDKNQLTEYAFMPRFIPNYYYSEEIPSLAWDINEDTLTVTGYLCQKATCSFRGRNYIAWFSMDIPINNGPWKFGGLPGLILKVYDENQDYLFECVGIENHKTEFSITSYDYSKYKKASRKNLMELWKKIFERYYLLVGGTGSFGNCASCYNPLELE